MLIGWIIFASVSGILEAIYFSKRRKLIVKGLDIHVWLTVIRSIVATPICLYVFFTVGLLESLLTGLQFVLVFPFFHDGFYYSFREVLRKGTYPKYFFDQSTTTSAKISLKFSFRAILLIIALIIC